MELEAFSTEEIMAADDLGSLLPKRAPPVLPEIVGERYDGSGYDGRLGSSLNLLAMSREGSPIPRPGSPPTAPMPVRAKEQPLHSVAV